jgi:homoserine dehydrogenase
MSTLRSLLETGDSVVRIEGVLSGTLSYVFNNFSAARWAATAACMASVL